MKAFLKAVIILSKALRRIAGALEGILELYRLDCRARGIEIYAPSKNKLDDEIMISYDVKGPESNSDKSPLDIWLDK